MDEHTPSLEERLDHRDLERFAREALSAAGVADEHARRIAEALVRADLRGIDSHGLARLGVYIRKFEDGGFNPDPDIAVESLGQAVSLVDADDGPGQSAAVRAMDEAMSRADEAGVGIAAVTNSNHFGTAAYYTERASDAGYIGMAMTNVGSDVAPFGGIDPFLGTNPISFSIPTDRNFPITLDMATSAVAMGKIDHADAEDERLPDHWALDEQGEPATRPGEVASLRPVGGPKGFGLAIVVDVFCGILTGVGPSHTVGALYDDFEDPMRLGHFFCAIDIAAFRDIESFRADIGAYIDRMKAQRTRDDIDEIRLPGELEMTAKRKNEREGVRLNEDAHECIDQLSERYDITPPKPA